MSDETQSVPVTDPIPDSLSSAVDADEIESMLEDDSLDAAGRELGKQIGREVGGRVGRRLGPSIAQDIRERKSPWSILKNAVRRLVTILIETLKNVDLSSGISKLTDVGRRILSEDSLKEGVGTVVPSGLVDSTDEESDEATETEGETDEAEGDEAEAEDEGVEDDASESDGVPDVEMPEDVDLSADEIQDLKEDTYRELLETMSYRDLQSVAKDVGVKANLAQDEMTDRIVDAFSEEGEA